LPDFGLAKIAEPADDAGEPDATRTMDDVSPITTEARWSIVSHMSPEQAQGNSGARSDIFGFGPCSMK
jgi:serine/threonine protein kinase